MIRGEPPISRALSTSLEAGHADLLNACKSDQAQLLRELIEQKEARLATTDVENLLHIAAQFGSADCLRFLLGCVREGSFLVAVEEYESSTIVDAKERFGATPLSFACQAGQLECAQLLLKAGASVHSANQDGDTPLLLALQNKNKIDVVRVHHVVQLLLDAGSDVLWKNSRGMAALEVAYAEKQARTADVDGYPIMDELEPRMLLEALVCSAMERAKEALVESRRTEKRLAAAKRREQDAKQAAAAAAELERQARESAPALAAEKARRAAEAAALQEQRRALASETEAKLAAERAAAEASLVLVREKAALAEAAERAESQKALAERKAAAAEHAQRVDEAVRAKAAEEESKRRAKLKDAADAKKAAKQEKKERRKAPSAFKLQHEQEERAKEEQRVEDQRATELAAALALQERQQDTLRAAERRAAELRAAELTAAEREASEIRWSHERHAEAELSQVISSVSGLALETRPSAQVEASAMNPYAAAYTAGSSGVYAARLSREREELQLRARLRTEEREEETRRLEAESVRLEQERREAQAHRREAEDSAAPTAPAAPAVPAAASQNPGADEAALCVVCFEKAKTHMVFPCGHRCLCEGCSKLMADACPMCRGPIVGICKVFL